MSVTLRSCCIRSYVHSPGKGFVVSTPYVGDGIGEQVSVDSEKRRTAALQYASPAAAAA